jgi:hypothetical protein
VLVNVPDAIAPHVAVACRRLAAQLERDGTKAPRELLALADFLLDRNARNKLLHERALSAARMRRFRARKAAERAA